MRNMLIDIGKLNVAQKRLHSIYHPIRLVILELLFVHVALDLEQLTKKLKLNPPAITHHLKLMKKSGVLKEARNGRKKKYYINRAELEYILDCVEKINLKK